MIQLNSNIRDRSFNELLPCCMSAVMGKIKLLDHFYLVRQDHPKRYLIPDGDVWVSSHNFKTSYEVFEEYIAKELSTIENIEVSSAKKIVRDAFSKYLAGKKEIQQFVMISQSESKNELMKQFPNLQRIFNGYKNIISKNIAYQKLIQQKLNDSDSNYINDYKPIFDIITNGKHMLSFCSNDEIQKGESIFYSGDLEKSEKYYLTMLNELKHSKVSFNNLGVIAFHKKEYNKAINYFVHCLEIDPYYKEAIINCYKVTKTIYQCNSFITLAILRYLDKYPNDIELSDLLVELMHNE